MRTLVIALSTALLYFSCSGNEDADLFSDAVQLPGGTFEMGTDDPNSYQHERPAHPVRVGPFLIDKTEVTNASFTAFINEMGYKTVAERKPEWEDLKKQLPPGTPKPADSLLQPGSLVFMPGPGISDLADNTQWWGVDSRSRLEAPGGTRKFD